VNPALCDNGEVRRIARDLSAKYGLDAMGLARSRAERAIAVGDELAYGIWEEVLSAMRDMKPYQF
jgi:hypothetical protein